MAGTQFAHGASTSGAEAYAYLRHNDPREESRKHILEAKQKTGQYCNIDPSMSKYNFSLIEGDDGNKQTAMQRYHAALDRAKAHDNPCVWRKDVYNKNGELIHKKGDVKRYAATRYEVLTGKDGEPLIDPVTDKPKKRILYRKGDVIMKSQANGKKKRTLMQSLVVYAPEGLNRKQRRAWFREAYKILCDKYGKENVAQAAVHEDEIHDYFDKKKNEWVTSRAHMHFSFVPVDKKTGELSANACTSRGDIMEVNNKLEEMTMQKYGCHYMTGTKEKNRYDIEELKAESARAGEEARASEAKLEKMQNDNRIHELEERIREQSEKMDRMNKEFEQMDAKIKKANDEKEKAEKERDEAREQRKEEEKKLDSAVYKKAKAETKTQNELDRLAVVQQQFRVHDPAEIFFTTMNAIADREEEEKGEKAGSNWRKSAAYIRKTYGSALTGMYQDRLREDNKNTEKRIAGRHFDRGESQKDKQKE